MSLNNALKIGPVLQDELFIILLRFRTFRIALTADIAKLYRQVLVHPKDSPLQRFLWREEPSAPLKVCELRTVTYGTASASYLTIKALRDLAETEADEFPIGSKIIMRDFHVVRGRHLTRSVSSS